MRKISAAVFLEILRHLPAYEGVVAVGFENIEGVRIALPPLKIVERSPFVGSVRALNEALKDGEDVIALHFGEGTEGIFTDFGNGVGFGELKEEGHSA